MDVPRLRKGQGVKGPEFYGCFNSGLAPVLMRAQTGEDGPDIYVVGPPLRAEEVREKVKIADKMVREFKFADKDGILPRRIWREKSDPGGAHTVWVFRSRKPAVEKFAELCGKVVEYNAEDRARHEKAISDAKSADPIRRIKGALALGEF